MDKLEAAKAIGSIEAHLARFEANLREAERRATLARANYPSGLEGILPGIVLLSFLWPLGRLLTIAGILPAPQESPNAALPLLR